MPVTPPRNTTSPNQALRASLLAADGVVRPAAEAPAAAVDLRLPDLSTSLLPTAPELLEASPNLQRLCESYHRTYRHMLARNRRQRLGLALSQSHAATVAVASSLVVAVGAASAVGVALLALLWVRDDRRLRRVQGDRLLRALQFNCNLHEERLSAFRRLSHPTAAFFDCYALWREQHP